MVYTPYLHKNDEKKAFRSHRVESISIFFTTLVPVLAHTGQVRFCCTPTPEPVYSDFFSVFRIERPPDSDSDTTEHINFYSTAVVR